MVSTLITHEFLRTRRWLAVVCGLVTLLTVIGALMAWSGWPLISQLGLIMSFLATGGFVVVVMLGLAYDYWRSSYSKTGYFTQSLPLKGSTIYGSKLLWGGIVTVVAILWDLVLGLIAYLGSARAVGVAGALRQLREMWTQLLTSVSPAAVVGIAAT